MRLASLRSRRAAVAILPVSALIAGVAVAGAGLAQGTVLDSHSAAQAATRPAGPVVALEFRAAYPASLYWVVNALAGDPHVETPVFRKWWAETGAADPVDQAHLDEFRRLRERYRGAYLDVPAPENAFVPVPPSDENDLAIRFATLFLGSTTLDEVWQKAEVLLLDKDARRLRTVFEHFDRRFAPRWARFERMQALPAAFSAASERIGLGQTLGQASWLYGCDEAATYSVRVALVFSPENRISHGRAIGRNLVVEVREGDSPERRLDVVAHEACHYLAHAGGLTADQRFLAAAFGSGAWHAGLALGLLDEGIATAIGQGVVEERLAPERFRASLAKPGSWYVDYAIDRYAKAIYPAVKEALDGGKTLADLGRRFVDAYPAAFPDVAPQPRMFLGAYVLGARNPRGEHLRAYFDAAPPRSLWRTDFAGAARMLRQYAAATLVIAVTPADFEELVAGNDAFGLAAADLERIRQAERGMMAVRRALHGYVFVVSGKDEADLGEAMTRFARLESLPAGWIPL